MQKMCKYGLTNTALSDNMINVEMDIIIFCFGGANEQRNQAQVDTGADRSH